MTDEDRTGRIGWTTLERLVPRRARVLVVEDDATAARGLRRLIEGMGHEVAVAESAETADRWLSQGSWDLVLLDIHLPRMNGVEFLHWSLRRAPTTAVIMVTGHDDAEVAIQCMKEGARTYLVKPVDPEILKVAVTDALAIRQLLLSHHSD